MSTLYLLAMSSVGIAILFAVMESVLSVSRRPNWQSARFAPALAVVNTGDRRTMQLPYVGQERREAIASAPSGSSPVRVAA